MKDKAGEQRALVMVPVVGILRKGLQKGSEYTCQAVNILVSIRQPRNL